MIGIYKIQNKINNKVYIGQSIDIKRRLNWHKKYYPTKIHRALYSAFEKYGIENFTFEVIEELNEKELNEREIYWIEFFNSFGTNGYNLTKGGNNIIGEENYLTVLTEDLVIKARIAYQNLENMLDFYYNSDFVNLMTESSFQNIWYGRRWQHIMPEVFSNEIKEKRKIINNQNAKQRMRSYNAKVTEEDVIYIREQKNNNISRDSVFESYKDIICKSTFRKIWEYETWKDIKI